MKLFIGKKIKKFQPKPLSEHKINEIDWYIDHNFESDVSAHREFESNKFAHYELSCEFLELPKAEKPSKHKVSYSKVIKESRSLDDVIKQQGETFSQRLLRMIDERGYTDAEVYKRANLDRRLFSKIRSNENYRPSKSTAIALAIALKLEIDDALDLLNSAGFTLSYGNKADLIVRYFMENKIFDVYELNSVLYKFDQILLW